MVEFAYYDNQWKNHVPETVLSAEDQYQRLTKALVELTGHEHITYDDNITLIPRKQREANFREAIDLVDRELKIGLDGKDKEMLTLVYTALSEVTRFAEDEHLEPGLGENTGTHSIHTPLRANLLISRALEQMGKKESRESVLMRQMTSLCLLSHDMGEALGEPGSLAQEVKHEGFKKDKPAAERLIANAILRMAACGFEKGDYQAFYDLVDKAKMDDISDRAKSDTDDDFLAGVRQSLGVVPPISHESEGRVSAFCDFWELQESGKLPRMFQGAEAEINPEFVSQLGNLSEHVQGTSHILLFLERGREVNEKGVSPWPHAQSARQIKNLQYVEGDLGHLFAAAKTPLEKAVAIEAKKEVYEKCLEFLESGSEAIDRTGAFSGELAAGDMNRAQEIAFLTRQSETEGELHSLRGQPHKIRNVETRDRLIEMYQWAMDHDEFMPEPGQTLIVDPPQAYEELQKGKFTKEVASSREASAVNQR